MSPELAGGFFITNVTWEAVNVSRIQLFGTPWAVALQAPLSVAILQVRILEWVAIPVSRGSSWPRDQNRVSHIAGIFFTVWDGKELDMTERLTTHIQTDRQTHTHTHTQNKRNVLTMEDPLNKNSCLERTLLGAQY